MKNLIAFILFLFVALQYGKAQKQAGISIDIIQAPLNHFIKGNILKLLGDSNQICLDITSTTKEVIKNSYLKIRIISNNDISYDTVTDITNLKTGLLFKEDDQERLLSKVKNLAKIEASVVIMKKGNITKVLYTKEQPIARKGSTLILM
jgi:hypothetical protein